MIFHSWFFIHDFPENLKSVCFKFCFIENSWFQTFNQLSSQIPVSVKVLCTFRCSCKTQHYLLLTGGQIRYYSLLTALVVKSSCYFPSLLMTPTGTQSGSQSVEVTLVRVTNILLTQDYALHSMQMIYVCKCQCKMQDVCKVCSISVQDVCNVCARCVQGVLNMCARCMHVMFDIIEPHAFRKYSTCWVLEKSEEPCRILKKFVHACVVNVIHAKVLPGSAHDKH